MSQNNNSPSDWLLAIVAVAIGTWIVFAFIAPPSDPRTECARRNREAKARVYGSNPRFSSSEYDLFQWVNGRCVQRSPRG